MTYTVDTNILIYHANGERSVANFLIEQFEREASLFLPTITIVEFFAFPALTPKARKSFQSLLPHFDVVLLDYDTALEAGKLRRTYGLKLGDSVIAATALCTGSALVSRNARDFKKIPSLQIISL